MVLWGTFIEPRKPYKLRWDKRRLRISQAVLGKRRGPWNSDYVVQCAIGSHPPFTICTLWDERPCYRLNLEFEEREDVVFSVDGPCGIHLVGYYIPSRATSSGSITTDELRVDFCGQDINSKAHDRNTGLTTSKQTLQKINTFADDDRCHSIDSNNEDRDIMRQYSASDDAALKEETLDTEKLLYQKSNQRMKVPDTCNDKSNEKNDHVIVSTKQDSCPTKKKRRTERKMRDVPVDGRGTSSKKINESAMSSRISKLSDGMTVEVLVKGNQDGKEASQGKQVKIYFSAKLCATGRDVGSNIGDEAPHQFRLGDKKIIKGLNIGIEGMRVGEKRRLTIPPSLRCSKKAKYPVEPDAWLQYDVELVDVCEER